MLEIISLIILIISIAGIAAIIRRKIPVLLQINPQEAAGSGIFSRFKINKVPGSKELFLHKILSKIRILMLKTDNKTTEWMKRLREKSQENNTKFSDSYWDKLRK
jgi:hypothetical protein